MHSVNVRGTWLVSKHALPYLKLATNPHILNISPPLEMKEKWFANHVAYSMSKIGMSMCVLGMAGEFRPFGIAVNALWPLTIIRTAALQVLPGTEDASVQRTPEIMADSAHLILTKDSRTFSGNFVIDEILLREHGVKDMDQYACVPGSTEFMPDFFVDEDTMDRVEALRSKL
jgi:citronellol/citronellal dehydrogenase